MSTEKNSGTAVEPAKDPAALRAEIAEIRADLGDTVEALAAKADVKAQAHAKVEQTKEQLREKAGHAKEQLEHTTGQLRVKAGEQGGHLREKAEQGRTTVLRYSPWPQVAVGAVALALAVLGGRAVRRRRSAAPVSRRLGRLNRR